MLVMSQYQPRLSSITKIISWRISQSDCSIQIKLNYYQLSLIKKISEETYSSTRVKTNQNYTCPLKMITVCKLFYFINNDNLDLTEVKRKPVDFQFSADTTLCDKSLSVTCDRSAGTPVSSSNKTGCHDIAEILLKVALWQHHKPTNQFSAHDTMTLF